MRKKTLVYKKLQETKPYKMEKSDYGSIRFIHWNADNMHIMAMFSAPFIYRTMVYNQKWAKILTFRGLRAYRLYKYGLEQIK